MRALTGLRIRCIPRTGPSTLPSSSRSFSSLRLLTPYLPSQSRPILPPQTPKLTGHPQSRPFSLLPLLETSITTSQTLLTTLHTTTLTPWYLTIPLFALTINLATRLPTTIYSRLIAIRRAKLAPLTRAWSARAAHDVNKQAKDEQEGIRSAARGRTQQDLARWMAGYHTANVRERKKRFRRWGVQEWKDWVPGLAVFPVWVVGIEGLRRMCGGPRGLVGTLVFGGREAGSGDGEQAAGAMAAPATGQVQEALTTAAAADPSMAMGGCLWFPDLMVADPYHVLPFALSAILVLNLLPRSEVGIRSLFDLTDKEQVTVVQSKWSMRLRRGLLMVAMAVGPLTMDLPAALHLYWICSATLTGVETEIIKRLLPMPKTVPPAKLTDKNLMYIQPAREETKES
ncbi:Mitochondrial inner membrane protein OXA1L [Madurella mycetomatis]|uniref:Mitochondrial inner membrane protein OXA1L n=1 Tax=Madurella mycetomatis TaxID=100816 RepID=A0A175W842_9PEZI|nr:Mitochondrial inner membrane protein OXA1L [Madurella mycetomatis]